MTLLSTIFHRASHIDGLFVDLFAPQLQSRAFLDNHNPLVQRKALQLLGELLPLQQPMEPAMQRLLSLAPAFVQHPAADCRLAMLNLLRDAWQVAPGLQGRLAVPLLAFLGDADGGVRGTAVRFWHGVLPMSLGPRLEVGGGCGCWCV